MRPRRRCWWPWEQPLLRASSERAGRGWSRDQTGRAIAAAVVAADRNSRFVGAVGNYILIVAWGNQYIGLAHRVVGIPWQGYPLAAGGTARFDSWQTDTTPVSVNGTAAAAAAAVVAAIVAAGCIAESIRWDLYLQNRSTVAVVVVAAAAAAVASQRSIVMMKEREEIRHLCLGSEKRRWRCDL